VPSGVHRDELIEIDLSFAPQLDPQRGAR